MLLLYIKRQSKKKKKKNLGIKTTRAEMLALYKIYFLMTVSRRGKKKKKKQLAACLTVRFTGERKRYLRNCG